MHPLLTSINFFLPLIDYMQTSPTQASPFLYLDPVKHCIVHFSCPLFLWNLLLFPMENVAGHIVLTKFPDVLISFIFKNVG